MLVSILFKAFLQLCLSVQASLCWLGVGEGGGGEQIFVLLYFKLLSRPSVKKYFIIVFKHFHNYFQTFMPERRNVSVLICHFPIPHPQILLPF